MILINRIPFEYKQFNDSTFRMVGYTDFRAKFKIPEQPTSLTTVHIDWKPDVKDMNSETLAVIFLVNHLKNVLQVMSINLIMFYLPNARMDRIEDYANEIFTLKYFCGLINMCNFRQVKIHDPHSRVSMALIDRADQFFSYESMDKVVGEVVPKYIVFPDHSAKTKYAKDFESRYQLHSWYCNKNREWNTNKILSTTLTNDLGDKLTELNSHDKILVVDDILSTGKTIAGLTETIHAINPDVEIFTYTSHMEQFLYNKSYPQIEGIKGIYSTDSVTHYGKRSEGITIYEL